MSTNLRAVFDLILQDAINADLLPEQMIKTIFIFTDMQFDSATDSNNSTFEDATDSNNNGSLDFAEIILMA